METIDTAELLPPGAFVEEELEARGWSQQDLADILGTSAEVISRTLSEFARKKLVAREGRGLKILDKERLRVIGGVQTRRTDLNHPPACVSSQNNESDGDKIQASPRQKKGASRARAKK